MSVMNMHAPVMLERAPEKGGRDAELHDRPSDSERHTVGEFLRAVVPLIFFVPVAGPPAILLMGPLLLLVLLLIPPAAFLITLAVVLLLGAGLLFAVGALIASPYLLVRHLRARHSIARPAPAASEVARGRDGRALRRSVRPHVIHVTTK